MNSNKHKIRAFSNFLIFCSGASSELLEKCPRFETTKYVCIGLTVFFTAILATISSFFAFSLVFDKMPLVIILSFFWGAIIFNLDRYIISSMRHSEKKWLEIVKVIPRLVIAILIAPGTGGYSEPPVSYSNEMGIALRTGGGFSGRCLLR